MPRKPKPPAARKPTDPALERPSCPPHLNAEAREEWSRLVAQLAAAGTIQTVDRAALAAYCVTFARWSEAERELSKGGLIVRSPNGYPIQSPYLLVANKALAQLKAFLTEFGLSPASRKRITPKPKTRSAVDDDDFSSLLD